jgi:mRNA interferase YafQ
MLPYNVVQTSEFKYGLSKIISRHQDIDELKKVVEKLSLCEKLPVKYRDHKLKGNLNGFRECHIKPDWLLVYKHLHEEQVLILRATGPHRELGLGG